MSYPELRSLEPIELRGAEMSLRMSSLSLSALFSSCNNLFDDKVIIDTHNILIIILMLYPPNTNSILHIAYWWNPPEDN